MLKSNVVPLNNTTDDGLEVVHKPMYKTSDGKVFECRVAAASHQRLVTAADKFVKSHQWDVYGHTMRGTGYERIYADNYTMESYTRNLLQHVKDGKIKLY